jgi:RNA polymerase sigma factor (sigma-70 family)
MRYSDAEVLEAIKGNQAADEQISYLYTTYFDSLTNFIRKNKGSQQDAEDIFQEVIVVFIELVSSGKFRGDSSIKTFLYAIARNIWYNELKKRDRIFVRDTEFYKISSKVEQDIQEGIEKSESKKQIFALIDRLGDACKKILVYFYYEELSIKEIWERMNYENEQVVRNKKYKCMKGLMELLDGNVMVKNTLKDLLIHGN